MVAILIPFGKNNNLKSREAVKPETGSRVPVSDKTNEVTGADAPAVVEKNRLGFSLAMPKTQETEALRAKYNIVREISDRLGVDPSELLPDRPKLKLATWGNN